MINPFNVFGLFPNTIPTAVGPVPETSPELSGLVVSVPTKSFTVDYNGATLSFYANIGKVISADLRTILLAKGLVT